MYAQECLKRTAECARLAEATNDPGLREYLTKLALSWMQSTTTAERNERLPADGPGGDGSRQFTISFSSNVRDRPPPLLVGNGLTPQAECRSSPPNGGPIVGHFGGLPSRPEIIDLLNANPVH